VSVAGRFLFWRCVVVTSVALSLAGHARAEAASARIAYDQANQSLNAGNGYETATNETGTLGWGESYVMMSHAEMFRATEDPRYLVALAEHAASVMASTDENRGIDDYAGRSRACWQATKYSPNGQPYCWAVHSGMLLFPMAELVVLVKQYPEYGALPVPGQGDLASAAQALLPQIEAAVAVFDGDWRSGPGSGEGHYIAESGATFLTFAGGAVPLNMMNAMGRAHIALYQATGDDAHHAKAEALAHYSKNRLHANGTAYAWSYWGDPWTGTNGEDISHAAINVDFAVLAQEAGLVFDQSDMQRLGATLFQHVHVDTATTHDQVDGGGSTNTYSDAVGRWIELSPYDPHAWAIGANQFRNVNGASGATLLALARIARYAPPIRDYSFYTTDWSDQGSYEKATAYGANILIDPPDPKAAYALRLGYRAWKTTTFAQWDGSAYHDELRLAADSSAMDHVFTPFDPAIYFGYSGTKALYEFEDTFTSAQGIEVEKSTPVAEPAISTTSLPPASAGTAYSTTLAASGDKPSFWRTVHAPAGVGIDPDSGELTLTPSAADAPSLSITVRVDNDAGHDQKTFALEVSGSAGTGGASGAGGTGGLGGGGGNPAATGGSSAKGGGTVPAGDDSGCGCRTARSGAPDEDAIAAFGFALAWVVRRRIRRRA
jgi:hypothetical protein